MKRSLFLSTVTLGIVLGAFACQDQGVMAPEDDAISPEGLMVAFAVDCDNPKFEAHPQCNGGGEDPPGEPTLIMTGAFSGEALDGGVIWEEKKGIFTARAPEGYISITVDVAGMGGPFEMEQCKAVPEGAEEAAAPLLEALNGGLLTGTGTTARVDLAALSDDPTAPGSPAVENRIFVFNALPDPVRYFWIGSWYETADGTTTDARVKAFVNDDDHAEWTLVGGAIGLRDRGSPNKVVKIHCPNQGEVKVVLTKG